MRCAASDFCAFRYLAIGTTDIAAAIAINPRVATAIIRGFSFKNFPRDVTISIKALYAGARLLPTISALSPQIFEHCLTAPSSVSVSAFACENPRAIAICAKESLSASLVAFFSAGI